VYTRMVLVCTCHKWATDNVRPDNAKHDNAARDQKWTISETNTQLRQRLGRRVEIPPLTPPQSPQSHKSV